MPEKGHAAVEFALAVGLLLLPVAITVLAFGPWSERRVVAEAAAAEAARTAVVSLDLSRGSQVVSEIGGNHGLAARVDRAGLVRVGAGSCRDLDRRVFSGPWVRSRGRSSDLGSAGHHALGPGGWSVGHRGACRAGGSLSESGMKGDRGSMTIWMLGLSVLLLLFGGLAIDFWRALALQRELSAVADSAAIAAASGIDEVRYRESGEVVLDPERARALGVASITGQEVDPAVVRGRTDSAGLSVSVVVVDAVELGLLGLLVDQTEPLTVRAEATASPRLLP